MPKIYEVILSDEAAKNIEDAYLWIAESDLDAAERWYKGLIEGLKNLTSFPLRCPVAPESRFGLLDREVRQYLYGPGYWKYRVLYAVDGSRVLVAHVRHGARLYLGQDESEEDASE